MSWQEPYAVYAAQRNLAIITISEGLGVEFTDGFDVFWLLPGEVTSTVPVRIAAPEDMLKLIAEFERIDRLRTSVLHVLRHNLADRRYFVDRRHSGEWDVMTEGGCSSTISVGPSLTARAVNRLDVYQLVAGCYENTILGKPPSRRRTDRYLSTDGPPVHELPWPDEAPTINACTTLRSVLLMSGLCRAVENEANLTSPQKLSQALIPKGRMGRALLRLADRLPQIAASWDLCARLLALDFDDGEDSYCIPPRSRDLAVRVRFLGVEAVGDQLADEYLSLNAARTAVLDAIKRAAFDRGWGVQRLRPSWLAPGIPARWFLGQTHREVELPVGTELTELLRTRPPTQALRQILATHPVLAEECVAALDTAGPPVTLPDRDLAPAVPTRKPRLRPLDPDTVAEMDAFADRTLAEYLCDAQTIWDYRWTNRFDSSRDTWATTADWIRLAERLVENDWPNPAAVHVLLDAHDPRGLERARWLLNQIRPHHESSDAEVDLVWRFRHERPDVARAWFTPQPGDQVPFAKHRAWLGDPVARRYIRAIERFEINDETTWTERANPAILGLQPSADGRDRVRRRVLEWARTTWKWSPAESQELQKALWLGLDDVVYAFDENQYLTNGLLCGDRKHVGLDEPGILFSGDFLLSWSRLQPTRLLAMVVATAHTDGVLAEADRIAVESAERNPPLRDKVDSSFRMYRSAYESLQIPLAIAWKHYRGQSNAR